MSIFLVIVTIKLLNISLIWGAGDGSTAHAWVFVVGDLWVHLHILVPECSCSTAETGTSLIFMYLDIPDPQQSCHCRSFSEWTCRHSSRHSHPVSGMSSLKLHTISDTKWLKSLCSHPSNVQQVVSVNHYIMHDCSPNHVSWQPQSLYWLIAFAECGHSWHVSVSVGVSETDTDAFTFHVDMSSHSWVVLHHHTNL